MSKKSWCIPTSGIAIVTLYYLQVQALMHATFIVPESFPPAVHDMLMKMHVEPGDTLEVTEQI